MVRRAIKGRLHWQGLIRCLTAIVCVSAGILQAQSKATVSQVEAAYLYNFGKFLQQPVPQQGPGTPLNICIAGDDDVHGALGAMAAGQTINGRPVSVKKLEATDDPKSCNILFASQAGLEKLKSSWATLHASPVLTVSDAPDFLKRGGMIQFELVNNRIRFEVNNGAARSAGLQLSSELLKVAVRVLGSPNS